MWICTFWDGSVVGELVPAYGVASVRYDNCFVYALSQDRLGGQLWSGRIGDGYFDSTCIVSGVFF